ncbi:Protein transport protein S9 plasma membrane t-SNARE, partial [Coemansia sp. RSA 2705]
MSSYSKGGPRSYNSSYDAPRASSRGPPGGGPSGSGPPGREQYGRYESPARSNSQPQESGSRRAYAKYDGGQGGRLGNSAGIRSHAAGSRAQHTSRYQATDMGSDEEYDMIKGQVQRVKQDTLESTRNSKRTLEQTDKIARETLTKLGQQTEQILNIDRKMEETMVRAEDSVEQSHKLQVLSGSIFRPHVKNPFTRKR